MSKITKRHEHVNGIIIALKASDEAIPFATLNEKVGNKFPADVVAAMYALETLGLVEHTKDGRASSYKWVGDKPAASSRRRRAAKKTDEVAA